MKCHLRKNSWSLVSFAILGVIASRPAAAASLSYTIWADVYIASYLT